MKYQVGVAAMSVGVTLLLAWFGVTSYFGAHPVAWPFQVALIGAPLGAIIAIIAGPVLPSKTPRVILFLALLLAAWGLAHYGKLGFAASYAEDRLAGQFWYYGWIATCAMATSVLATMASPKT
ncbi:MAG: hypothetical protein ACR2RE_31095 [Geminicoccaceae bacterium]